MDKLTFEEFSEYYQVKRNPINANSPYANTMLDYGDEELNYLGEIDRDNIWSLIDGNKNNLILSAGLQYKNVIGFFITKRPWIKNEKYALK